MHKGQFVSIVAKKAGLTHKEVRRVIDAFFETVGETVNTGESIHFLSWGHFSLREKPARAGFDPRTRESITITPRRTLVFKPGQALQQMYQNKKTEG